MFKDLKIFDVLYLGNTETNNITEHIIKDVSTISDDLLSIIFETPNKNTFKLTISGNVQICKRNEFIIGIDRNLVENMLNNY